MFTFTYDESNDAINNDNNVTNSQQSKSKRETSESDYTPVKASQRSMDSSITPEKIEGDLVVNGFQHDDDGMTQQDRNSLEEFKPAMEGSFGSFLAYVSDVENWSEIDEGEMATLPERIHEYEHDSLGIITSQKESSQDVSVKTDSLKDQDLPEKERSASKQDKSKRRRSVLELNHTENGQSESYVNDVDGEILRGSKKSKTEDMKENIDETLIRNEDKTINIDLNINNEKEHINTEDKLLTEKRKSSDSETVHEGELEKNKDLLPIGTSTLSLKSDRSSLKESVSKQKDPCCSKSEEGKHETDKIKEYILNKHTNSNGCDTSVSSQDLPPDKNAQGKNKAKAKPDTSCTDTDLIKDDDIIFVGESVKEKMNDSDGYRCDMEDSDATVDESAQCESDTVPRKHRYKRSQLDSFHRASLKDTDVTESTSSSSESDIIDLTADNTDSDSCMNFSGGSSDSYFYASDQTIDCSPPRGSASTTVAKKKKYSDAVIVLDGSDDAVDVIISDSEKTTAHQQKTDGKTKDSGLLRPERPFSSGKWNKVDDLPSLYKKENRVNSKNRFVQSPKKIPGNSPRLGRSPKRSPNVPATASSSKVITSVSQKKNSPKSYAKRTGPKDLENNDDSLGKINSSDKRKNSETGSVVNKSVKDG